MKNQEKETNPFLLYYGINLPHPYRTESSGFGNSKTSKWVGRLRQSTGSTIPDKELMRVDRHLNRPLTIYQKWMVEKFRCLIGRK